MSAPQLPLLTQAWRAVAGTAVVPATLGIDSAATGLPSTLPVADAAVACVGTALLAAAALRGDPPGTVRLPAAHVAVAVRSERYLRVAGKPVAAGFAPLSRFWRSADGWVRTHANYPWHREALLAALDSEGDVDAVAAAVAALPATEVEARVVAGDGVAAAVRTREEWLAHPQGRAVAQRPLVADRQHAGAAPRHRAPGPLPASGVRVLDLTRVIAGPVATRYLAALGADVLRLDPPHRPELPLHRHDGLLGKRSALLDAGTAEGLARLHELLDSADVLVHGYRPGALRRFGLDGDALAERHPGLVVVSLSAWGSHGPWGDRRGFDSIVQAASGIAVRESPDGDRPGALPCQLLDHGAGYLCAAAVLDGLRRQAEHGGTLLRELSLARTAHWLLGQPAQRRSDGGETDPAPWLTTVEGPDGAVTTVAPPGELAGRPLRWSGAGGYGDADPAW